MKLLRLEQLTGMNIHYRYYTLEDCFRFLNKLGFKSVEIWSSPYHFYLNHLNYQDTKKIKKMSREYDLNIVCITPEQNNPKPHNIAAGNDEIKKRTLEYFKNAIRVANEFECNRVVVTSGWAFYSENKEEAWKRSVEMLNNLCEFAKENGVILALEALQPQESILVNDILSLKRMLEDVASEQLKVTIDMGAMAKAGETIQDYFDAFGDRVVHTHFVDGKPTGHLAWGDGERNLVEDLKSFKRNNYKGFFTLEYATDRYYKEPFKADKQTMDKIRQFI